MFFLGQKKPGYAGFVAHALQHIVNLALQEAAGTGVLLVQPEFHLIREETLPEKSASLMGWVFGRR